MTFLSIEYIGDELRAGIVHADKAELQKNEFISMPMIYHTPSKFLGKVHEIVKLYNWKGPLSIAFPGAIRDGIVMSSTPFIESAWHDTDLKLMVKEMVDLETYIFNGADAVGYAEMHHGAGRELFGTTLVLSIGSSIRSSLFQDKFLLPNTQFGLLKIQSFTTANDSASNQARKKGGLKRKAWAKRVEQVLHEYNSILNPDQFVLCGEICHKAEKVLPFIQIDKDVIEAGLYKYAGMIGAACMAMDETKKAYPTLSESVE